MSEVAISQPKPVPTWRKVSAGILDFLFILFVGGYLIAYISGGITENGFELHGAPALVLFATIILYFVIFRRYLGGTVCQRLLGAR